MNPMNSEHALRDMTRRHFFSRCSMGIGSLALASLMAERGLAATPSLKLKNPLEPKKTHFPAKAKNVIFLFMAGGPSQLDLFEHKPQLTALNGQPIPESYTKGKRLPSWTAVIAQICSVLSSHSNSTGSRVPG